jgi:molecular chaperone GrpE
MIDVSKSPASVVVDSAPLDLASLQTALAMQKDDYLGLAADFDNFRKRTRRDSGQQAAAEKESFIHDLLPILDNLERALAFAGDTSSAQLHQGVEMTLKQLSGLLQRHGIENVAALGLPFDPHRHEAVAVECDPQQPDHIVLKVIQGGYCRGDKVFRPAKVIVNDPDQTPGTGRGR